MYTKLHNDTGNLTSIPSALQPNYAKTTVTIVDQYTFFDNGGIIMNPESIVFDGYWAESRVAEVLPSDYSPGN